MLDPLPYPEVKCCLTETLSFRRLGICDDIIWLPCGRDFDNGADCGKPREDDATEGRGGTICERDGMDIDWTGNAVGGAGASVYQSVLGSYVGSSLCSSSRKLSGFSGELFAEYMAGKQIGRGGGGGSRKMERGRKQPLQPRFY